jgi:SAM-dependent methyltransferase
MTEAEIWEAINSVPWFHRFELAPGVWSPGRVNADAKFALDHSGIPADLRGKRVIDIGAYDGAYSFEFAKRGAEVLAIDVQAPFLTGFGVASSIMSDLPVQHCVTSVYNLDETVGEFDIAWYWGVFYHLKEPLLAFRRLHDILRPDGLLCFEGAVLDEVDEKADPRLAGLKPHIDALRDVPLTYFTHGAFGPDWSNWYIPNMACLREWLLASGFKDIDIACNPTHSRGLGTARKNRAFNHREYHVPDA